jgi:hypothetical protein
MPVMRDILNSTGQERTAWLNRTLKPAEEALRYYLGPDVTRAVSSLGQLLTEMSPAADIRDMAQSSRDLMGSGSLMDAAGNAAMLGAAALGVFTPGSASSVKGATSDGVDAIVKALREGRAGEVTDDMLGALTPEQNARLFNAYERGETGADMAMDEASRMARAREMGFDVDTPLYHGTGADIQAFDLSRAGTGPISGNPIAQHGIFTSPMPDYTEVYGSTIMPVTGAAGNFRKVDMFSPRQNDMMDAKGVMSPERVSDFVDKSKRAGDSGMSLGSRGSEWERMFYDPRNIRSRFARFDPRLKNLSNLSAAVPGFFGAGTLGALLAARDDEVQQ